MNDVQPAFPNETTPPPSFAPPEFAPAPKPTLRRLFFGDDGLRAGWSIFLFLILLIPCGFVLGLAVHFLHLIPFISPRKLPPMTPRFITVGNGVNFGAIALAALLMSFIERRPFTRYGLSQLRLIPDFLTGLFWGIAALSVLVASLAATHSIALDGVALRGSLALAFGLKWFLGFLMVGLCEEFLFRGYLLYTLARGVAGILRAMDPVMRHTHARSFWISAGLISVLLFTMAHLGNPGETLVGILGVACAGLVLVFALYRTGTLWWAIGFHTSWDWAQSCLYGTPDSGTIAIGHILSSHPVGPVLLSGGSAGPEGSLLVLPTLALVGLVIHFTLPRRGYPVTRDQSPAQSPASAV
jgi:membrane protease YdiL (CAAX protease family)